MESAGSRARITPPEPRTTDAGTTLAGMVLDSAERNAARPALRSKRGEHWADLSYRELGEAVRAIARGLIALGIEPGDRIAILGSTRPEWTLVDCAALCAGAVVVPLYPASSPDECTHILRDSAARAIVCEDARQVAKIAGARAACPELEHVIALTGARREVISLADVRLAGAVLDAAAGDRTATGIDPGDPATVVYAPDATGRLVGRSVSHARWCAAVRAYATRLGVGDGPTIFLFLPLADELARISQMVALDRGGTLAFWQGDAARVLDDLAATRPDYLPAGARVLEAIHANVLRAVGRSTGANRALFDGALTTGGAMRSAERASTPPGRALRARYAVADRLVLARVRALFGGRLSHALTCDGPLEPAVAGFFDACGVPVTDSSGLTGSSPLSRPRRAP